ncbi:MAG: hypothetical protein WKF92_16595 [Pyrinomonadaceae bacterium]
MASNQIASINRNSVDFSNGLHGKHAAMNLQVMGAVDSVWAVCVTKTEKDLIPFKLYSIETYSASGQIKVNNEKGEAAFYPKDWFTRLDVSK